MSTEWALGDYHQFAKTALWDLGPQLVAAGGDAEYLFEYIVLTATTAARATPSATPP
ncbi:hypothetical protein [Nocardia terpenica]|uniref:Uncharacterized protein n=1 Tax=Nocardia terpenica TaxID=455432 RepID=A0A6G9Z326_9NOCA|nr:hypothetical protein [Nocardia terpenica]QIS19918.1 hypothetical protein F6W96_18075 [Nocardia terpenica]